MRKIFFYLFMLLSVALLFASSSSGESLNTKPIKKSVSKKQTSTPQMIFVKNPAPLRKVKTNPSVRKPRALPRSERITAINHARILAGIKNPINIEPPVAVTLTPRRPLVGGSSLSAYGADTSPGLEYVTIHGDTNMGDPCGRGRFAPSCDGGTVYFRFQTIPGKNYVVCVSVTVDRNFNTPITFRVGENGGQDPQIQSNHLMLAFRARYESHTCTVGLGDGDNAMNVWGATLTRID